MRLFWAMLFVAAVSGCVAQLEEPELPDADRTLEVPVRFAVMTGQEVKSSLDMDETYVGDINIYAFRNGKLDTEVYTSDIASVSLNLVDGCTYNLYALANAGKIPSGPDEKEFLDSLTLRFKAVEDISEGVPMVWKKKDLAVSDRMMTVEVKLCRLISRVRLSLDKSLLEGFSVKSVRLCQSPVAVRPFRVWDSGSRAESPAETVDGDYASADDLESLNSGGTVEFFVLENCQGDLLPDNRDPWLKVPENVGERASLCTYIEMSGVFDEDYVLEGEASYRFYLGLDNCSNFDIPANSTVDVRLCITDDALKRMSWQVDADVSIRDGYVWGYVSHGRHEMYELYVGETVLYEVELSAQMQKLLKDSAGRCSLEVHGEEGKSSCVWSAMSGGDGECYRYEVKGLEPFEGILCLIGPDGEKLAELEKACVLMPEIKLSSEAYSGDYVSELASAGECAVNGEVEDVYLYMIDRNGMNLNSEAAYDFDVAMFDYVVADISSEYGIEQSVACEIEKGDPCSGGFAAKISVSCSNDGTDHSLNSALVSALESGQAFDVSLYERKFSIQSSFSAGIDYLPIRVVYVDNGWAGYHDSQISVKVDNPSNLPLEFSCWQLNSSNDDWNAIARNEILDYVEDNLQIDRIGCLSADFSDDASYVYVSSHSFRSERNENGADAVEEGDVLIYSLDGISTDDIYKAQLYHKSGQESMVNMFDVTIDGVKAIPDDNLSLSDRLQDGSSRYSMIYGKEGWDDLGGWLYSGDMFLYSTYNSLFMDDYPGFTPHNLDVLQDMYGLYGLLDLHFSYSGGKLYVYSLNADNYDVLLTFRFSGTVNGYVETYPNGTWGSAKDNYCSATFSKTVTGVKPVTVNGVACADGGVLKEAMDAVYANAFYDSKNWIGSSNSYMHNAHPVDMTFKMEVLVEKGSAVMLCPVSFTWDMTSIGYYHAQDAVTYNCSVSPSVSEYNAAIVSRQ